MKHFSQLLFVLFLSPFFSVAQSFYQPGVIVNLKGDSLHGYIDYHDWENNPQSILFRPGTDGNAQKLSPNDIKYFSVSVGRLVEYSGYAGPVSTDNTDIYRISIGKDSSFRQDTVFLKVLESGKNILLFSLSDSQKIRFFISGNFSEKPVELVYRVYWNSAEANGVDKRTVYDNSFKGQLYDAAVKAGVMTAALKNDIKNAEYNEDQLANIVSIINGPSSKNFSKNDPSKGKHLALHLLLFGILAIVIIKLSLATFPNSK